MDEAVGGGIERVEAEDTRAAVERSLHRLSDDQREVLVLRLFGDKSYREIAEAMGLASENTANSLFLRARDRLAAHLEGADGD